MVQLEESEISYFLGLLRTFEGSPNMFVYLGPLCAQQGAMLAKLRPNFGIELLKLVPESNPQVGKPAVNFCF